MKINRYKLPYAAADIQLAAHLVAEPWGVWLDSGQPGAELGRYDIMVARPSATLVARDGLCEWRERGERRLVREDPLEVLRRALSARGVEAQDAPFCGGAVGYFGYDLGQRLEGVEETRPGARLPEMAVGFYDWAVITDHARQERYWIGRDGAEAVLPWLRALLQQSPPAASFAIAGGLREQPDRAGYAERFARVQRWLRAGDCYQINLARRFAVPYRGDPWEAYRRLRRRGTAPYGAFLRLPFASLLSLSPERFVSLRGGQALTQPIKGTRPRGSDSASDRLLAESLASSPKDRAENVMIVDLLRNDFGKVCRPGSVRVPQLCAVESFPLVHHLVSTVTGTLEPGRDAVDLLRACLPGGSITGAPKRHVVSLIAQLEPQPRGPYCGAIGYISDDGAMDTNVAIRTAVCADGEMSYWAGGGVVIDSTEEEEFRETEHKARAFLDLIEAGEDFCCTSESP